MFLEGKDAVHYDFKGTTYVSSCVLAAWFSYSSFARGTKGM